MLILVATNLVVILPIVWFPRLAAAILAGNPSLHQLLVAISLTVLGGVLAACVRASYFGQLRFGRGNAILVGSAGAAPVFVLLIAHHDVASSMSWIGATGVAIALIGAAGFVRYLQPATNIHRLIASGKDLLSYSAPRMPGDLALSGLLSVATLWVAHVADVKTAGYVSLSQSLVSAITAAFVPLSIVILPRATASIASRGLPAVASRIPDLIEFTLLLSTYIAVQIAVFADTLLVLWLGEPFVSATPILRTLLASVPMFAV